MKTLYVISGTWKEYDDYMYSRRANDTMLIYVRDKTHLYDVRNPDGVFIGSFKNRPDLIELLNYMLLIMHDPTKYAKIMGMRDAAERLIEKKKLDLE